MSERRLGGQLPLRIAPGYRFQWEETQHAHVLLYPEGMIQLNDSAAAVLKYCDGSRSPDDIVGCLEREFPGAELREDVMEFLEDAYAKGWIRNA